MATVPPLIPKKLFSGEIGASNTTTTSSGSQRKVLSKQATDKLIYDVLSSDQGLAALASGENSSGGYGSSTKGLMAQDLTAKLVGELANITAETITNESGSQKTRSGKVGTVICTELVRLGLMDRDLYDAGASHFFRLDYRTIIGYQAWAVPIARLIRKYPRIAPIFLPVANARYRYLVQGKFSIMGWTSVKLAEPICFMIGSCIPTRPILNQLPIGE
jgi:hypothetical protein